MLKNGAIPFMHRGLELEESAFPQTLSLPFFSQCHSFISNITSHRPLLYGKKKKALFGDIKIEWRGMLCEKLLQ